MITRVQKDELNEMPELERKKILDLMPAASAVPVVVGENVRRLFPLVNSEVQLIFKALKRKFGDGGLTGKSLMEIVDILVSELSVEVLKIVGFEDSDIKSATISQTAYIIHKLIENIVSLSGLPEDARKNVASLWMGLFTPQTEAIQEMDNQADSEGSLTGSSQLTMQELSSAKHTDTNPKN